MPAYVIFIREKTTNIEELNVYASKAPSALQGHLLKPLVMYGMHEVIEGPEIEGAAVLEFPGIEEAKSWYYSPAYQDAVKHRMKGGTYRGIIVEGFAKEGSEI
ncbi:hypothetical protein A8709_23055 [Paenibacillus pectinilyticus]|uniref:DUF1330 domain-containing protein n=1 Tax=Paenibacillus pectinilyticus TaxID=512399 RepID=A0A1C0ZRM7_9BACL|nr:DUF1330 domain-containing protein [Paenibacillus pectinilyticus]OCT10719.1 hypothetical protein A8709_23055 [Paenibacillus pectinilyticus]